MRTAWFNGHLGPWGSAQEGCLPGEGVSVQWVSAQGVSAQGMYTPQIQK